MIYFPGRVLSIQSTVVSGSVGNKSAVFPLQALGWDVDPLHTVQLSNHKGPRYPSWKGMHFSAEHFSSIFQALDENCLLDQNTHLLTGYVPNAESLGVLTTLVPRMREINPDLIYVLDPVMGDDGRLYVNEDVIPLYKELVAIADIITPNDYEATILTGIDIKSFDSLLSAITTLHSSFSVPHVVVSSACLPESPNTLLCVGSSMNSRRKFKISFPRLSPHFVGVGDVFSALLLAHYRPEDCEVTSSSDPGSTGLGRAAYSALCSLRAILLRTEAHAEGLVAGKAINLADPKFDGRNESREERTKRLSAIELRLVQSWDEIRNPPHDPAVIFEWL